MQVLCSLVLYGRVSLICMSYWICNELILGFAQQGPNSHYVFSACFRICNWPNLIRICIMGFSFSQHIFSRIMGFLLAIFGFSYMAQFALDHIMQKRVCKNRVLILGPLVHRPTTQSLHYTGLDSYSSILILTKHTLCVLISIFSLFY